MSKEHNHAFTWKRVISLVLAVAMLLAYVPAGHHAHAEETDNSASAQSVTTLPTKAIIQNYHTYLNKSADAMTVADLKLPSTYDGQEITWPTTDKVNVTELGIFTVNGTLADGTKVAQNIWVREKENKVSSFSTDDWSIQSAFSATYTDDEVKATATSPKAAGRVVILAAKTAFSVKEAGDYYISVEAKGESLAEKDRIEHRYKINGTNTGTKTEILKTEYITCSYIVSNLTVDTAFTYQLALMQNGSQVPAGKVIHLKNPELLALNVTLQEEPVFIESIEAPATKALVKDAHSYLGVEKEALDSAKLNLPATVTVNGDVNASVQWDLSSLDVSVPGVYFLPGTVTADGVHNVYGKVVYQKIIVTPETNLIPNGDFAEEDITYWQIPSQGGPAEWQDGVVMTHNSMSQFAFSSQTAAESLGLEIANIGYGYYYVAASAKMGAGTEQNFHVNLATSPRRDGDSDTRTNHATTDIEINDAEFLRTEKTVKIEDPGTGIQWARFYMFRGVNGDKRVTYIDDIAVIPVAVTRPEGKDAEAISAYAAVIGNRYFKTMDDAKAAVAEGETIEANPLFAGCGENHTYNNACDASCNVCGETREVGEHVYDNACDAICNECGAIHEVGEHKWVDADCDTPKTCSECGKTEGSALGHIDGNDNDHNCDRNGCNAEDITEHKWVDADCDTPKTCSECGKTEGNANGHALTKITCNNDKTHTLGCANCDYTEKENCVEGADHKCAKCGYVFAQPVAQVGETLCYSLQDAFVAIMNGAGTTVKLLANATWDGPSGYHLNASGLTLDLGGKTLTMTNIQSMQLVGDGFTLKNGTIDGRGASYGLFIGNGETWAEDVLIEDVTVLGGINMDKARNITLRNCTVNADVAKPENDFYAVYLAYGCYGVVIESGSYNAAAGVTAIYASSAGGIDIRGGSFSSNVTTYCKTGHTVLSEGKYVYGADHSYVENVVDPDFGKEGYTEHTCACGHSYKDTYVPALVAVAQIGNKNYESLQEALNAAQNGQTVTLLADIAVTQFLQITTANNGEVARNITLDLNGKTISTAANYNYNNGWHPLLYIGLNQTVKVQNGTIVADKAETIGTYGLLTLEEVTVKVNRKTEDDIALYVYHWTGDENYPGPAFGQAALKDCTVEGGILNENILSLKDCEVDFVIVDEGKTTISGGNIASIEAVAQIDGVYYGNLQEALDAAQNGQTVKLLADIAVSRYLDVKMAGYAARTITLDLNGKTISAGEGYNYNTGYPLLFVGLNQTVNVTGGGEIVSNKYVTVGTYGVLNVVNATIKQTGRTSSDIALYVYHWTGGAGFADHAFGKANISGGEIIGGVLTENELNISGGKVDFLEIAEGKTTITGGTIDSIEAVAKIGNAYFGTLQEAIDNANGGEILLLADHTGDVTVPAGATLNLNGHVLTGNLFGKLSVNGGTLRTPAGVDVFYDMVGPNAHYYKSSDAVLTMDGPTGDITVHSGKLELVPAEWWTGNGQTLIIDTEAEFIIPAGKVLNVNNSTVIIRGKVTCNGTVKLLTKDTTITAPVGLNVVTSVADHKVVHKDGVYSVIAKNYVASVGNKQFESVQEAINHANNGTVVILQDIKLTETLIVDGNITVTIDMNGKTITADWAAPEGLVEVLWVLNGANVTITGNGSMISGDQGGTNSVVSATDGAKVTIENGTFISENYGDVIYASRGAVVTINDGHFEAKKTFSGRYWVLDIQEGDAPETWGKILVKGGDFVNFDPANHRTDGANYTNKLAEGYHSIGKNGVYTVEKHAYTAQVTPPNCVDDGFTTHTCACGDSYVDTSVDALGHNYKSVVTPPSCTQGGYTTHTCDVCGASYTSNATLATGHSNTYTPAGNGKHTVGCENCDLNEIEDCVENAEHKCEDCGQQLAQPVAQIGSTPYYSLQEAIAAAQNNDTIILLTDCTVSADITIEGKTLSITGATLIVPSGVTFAIKDSNVSIEKLNTADDVVQVSGVCTLNFASVTGGTIKICDDAVLVDCNINGTCWLAGPVTFRGYNVILMISDFGAAYGAPGAKWTVEEGASLTLTKNDRYGLGYGDSAVIYGSIEDALEAAKNREDLFISVNMYGGLVGMTNSGYKNTHNYFTVQDAYVRFGHQGDKSFGNKPGNYYGTYSIVFENTVADFNAFKFYEDNGTSNVTFEDSDLLVNGIFMTNDTSSVFNFTNCIILSKATSNGSDDKNQNAGEMNLVGTQLTYNAMFTNIGTVHMDLSSVITAPKFAGNGKIVIDASGFAGEDVLVLAGDLSGYTGTIEATGNAKVVIDEQGAWIVRNAEGTANNVYAEENGFWGRWWGNANESWVIKFFNGNTYMGFTSLNNIDGILDGDVEVSWHINFNTAADTDHYWTSGWEVAPSMSMLPNRAEFWIDGEKVDETTSIKLAWADDIFPVVAAVTDADGKIVKFVNNYNGNTAIAAIEAAQDGQIIELMGDITTNQRINIQKSVTINGNGHTLTYTGTDRAINVAATAAGVNLTVQNLNLVAANADRGITYNTTGALTLDNVQITAKKYAINMAGTANGAIVNISDSELTANFALNIWGKNMTINVVDSELYTVGSTGNDGSYAAIALNNDSITSAEGTIVTVTGGKIIAQGADLAYSVAVRNATATGKVNISDTTEVFGRIVENVAAVLYDNTTDSYGFETLQEAIDKALATNGKVVLLRDVTISSRIEVTKDLVIDGNGHTLTYTGTDRAINVAATAAGANLTVQNLNLVAANADRGITYNTTGTLTLDNVQITAKKYAINMAGTADGAKVNITDSMLKANFALNIWGENMTINVTNSELYTVGSTGNDGSYAAIALNNDSTTAAEGTIVTVTGGKIIAQGADLAYSVAVRNATSTGRVNVSNETEVFGRVVQNVATVLYSNITDSYGFTSLQDAINKAAASNGKVVLLTDLEISNTITINGAVVIDLNGKTITANCQKAFEVYADATIQNGTIKSLSRCVDTRTNVELTLVDLTLIADDYHPNHKHPQPLTIGGYDNGTKVNMTNVNISAKAGYGIITFVKTDLTATNCTITGYNALYVKEAVCAGSNFNFVDCDLTGDLRHNDVEGNAMAVIAIRADNVTVNVDAASTINALGNHSKAVSVGNNLAIDQQFVSGVNVKIAGTINGNVLAATKLEGNTVTVPAAYADKLNENGYAHIANADGTVTAAVAVAEVNGVKYATIQEAIDHANGGTVVVLQHVDLTETLVVDGNVTVILDLAGHTIKADWEDPQGLVEVLWIKNGANVTITGNGAMISGNKGGTNSVVSATDGAELTIENGTFISYNIGDVVYASRNAVVTIKGGLFEAKQSWNGQYWVLDIYELDAPETWGKIVVEGGEFVNFDPANHRTDGANYTNKLADQNKHTKHDENNVYSICEGVHDAVVTDPDCVNDGYTTHTCPVCEDQYVDTPVDALGHVDAENDGDHICDRGCGETVSEHSWNDATCTAPETCSECNATQGVALGHVDAENDGDHTCDRDGCNETVSEHSWNDATCTAPKTCSECNATQGNALGHFDAENDGDHICDRGCGETVSQHNWSNATCTAPETCSECNATQGNALGHDWVKGAHHDATYESDAYDEYACSRCPETKVEYQEDTKLVGAAIIGTTQYETLQAAINAATADATIKLLKNFTGDFVIVNKPVIINLNGFTMDENLIFCGKYNGEPLTTYVTGDAIIIKAVVVSDVDAGEANAYIDGDPTNLMTLQKALDEAKKLYDGQNNVVVKLSGNITVNAIVMIPQGVTLDIGSNTLTVNSLIGVEGSKLTGDTDAKKNDGLLEGGLVKVEKENLILDEKGYQNSQGQYILPIWDPNNNRYVFSLIVMNTDPTKDRGFTVFEEENYLYFQFKHQATSDVNKLLLANGGSENGVSVVIRLEWVVDASVGVDSYTFVFTDGMIQTATGSQDYYFKLKGYTALGIDMENLVVQAMLITDSGATAYSARWGINGVIE